MLGSSGPKIERLVPECHHLNFRGRNTLKAQQVSHPRFCAAFKKWFYVRNADIELRFTIRSVPAFTRSPCLPISVKMNEPNSATGLVVPQPPLSKLTACITCENAISVLAQTCPKCGAPNTWQHPGIKHFLSIKDATGISRKFTFVRDRISVTGHTAPKLTFIGYGAVICALLSAIVIGLAFAWWAGLICAFVLPGVAASSNTRFEWFKADFNSGIWVSSNEKFWKPVREKLQLKAPTKV
jgi:hypothetical protein